MKTDAKSRGTWFHRLVIRFFTVVLAVLIYWVLGFLVDDIRSLPGPDYSSIEKKHLDPGLVARKADLERQIAELTRQIENQTEKQRVVGTAPVTCSRRSASCSNSRSSDSRRASRSRTRSRRTSPPA